MIYVTLISLTYYWGIMTWFAQKSSKICLVKIHISHNIATNQLSTSRQRSPCLWEILLEIFTDNKVIIFHPSNVSHITCFFLYIPVMESLAPVRTPQVDSTKCLGALQISLSLSPGFLPVFHTATLHSTLAWFHCVCKDLSDFLSHHIRLTFTKNNISAWLQSLWLLTNHSNNLTGIPSV